MNELVCNQKDCPKRTICKVSIGVGKFDMADRCTCMNCDWSKSSSSCPDVGNPYNIDDDCIAFK